MVLCTGGECKIIMNGGKKFAYWSFYEFYWIGFESRVGRYLQIGPNSVSLSKEHAPVVPKVAQSWIMKEEVGLCLLAFSLIYYVKCDKIVQ